MAEERSLIAFEHYREAEQRFEYFIAGVSTALCAYVGQNLHPERFGPNSYTIQVVSIGLVVISIIFSFKRIETGVFLHQLNHDLLHLAEVRGQLVTNFQGQPIINELTGDFMTPQQMKERIEQIEASFPLRKKQLKNLQAKILKYYRWRNWLLLIGFIGLVLSKILAPYIS